MTNWTPDRHEAAKARLGEYPACPRCASDFPALLARVEELESALAIFALVAELLEGNAYPSADVRWKYVAAASRRAKAFLGNQP